MSSTAQSVQASEAAAAAAKVDEHVREMIGWHFSPQTGCPFWLEWAEKAGWDPVKEVRGFDGLSRFPHFDDEWLRFEPHERWVPKPYEGRPYKIFETGGTTGLPKQRISWEDHEIDYTEFSESLSDESFPRGTNWLMLGPTGPRRLRLSIEHLANIRGGSCYHTDLDPRWVKILLGEKRFDEAKRYMDHVINHAVDILKHRKVACLFATPKLLEALGERLSLAEAGIKGVFLGGTSMTPQMVRFLVEEVLDGEAEVIPTYGNTLMGLARGKPVGPDRGYEITYYAPQPRAILNVVDPENTDRVVDYGQWGRIMLTTLTKEFFMPRFLERDEATRERPTEQFPWDGVGNVRPFGSSEKKVVEGVY